MVLLKQLNHYFATCSKGVEDILQNELEELGVTDLKIQNGGVSFTGNIEYAYKACLWSRVASRILFQLKEFEISSDDDLYNEVYDIDWSEHFSEHDSGLTSLYRALMKCKSVQKRNIQCRFIMHSRDVKF